MTVAASTIVAIGPMGRTATRPVAAPAAKVEPDYAKKAVFITSESLAVQQ